MTIFVIGLNFKTAALAIREQAYFPLEKISLYLQEAMMLGVAQEIVILSTCNRTELICIADDLEAMLAWFYQQTAVTKETLAQVLYVYEDQEAIAHLMAVASGLDSLVLGEPQILGQLKEAFSESCAAGAVSRQLHLLFRHVFSVAKEIRATTAIGACPVSVATTAIHFISKVVTTQLHLSLSEATIALIGAGDQATLLYRYLRALTQKPILRFNRQLAAFNHSDTETVVCYPLDIWPTRFAEVDIVFSATGSLTPIFTKEKVQACMLERQSKPLLFMDVAVPRDVQAAVGNLPNVSLYCVDDLKAMIETHRQGREHAAEKAREMIIEKSKTCYQALISFENVSSTIRAYRAQIETVCGIELEKAKQQLSQGANPYEVLNAFAYAFTNKLLHVPSVELRKAGVEGRFELLHYAKQLFALSDTDADYYELIKSSEYEAIN